MTLVSSFVCLYLFFFSNFNNARILVRKLEQRGIAGACIEDKLFPKTNSLLADSESKPLASIEEFSGKEIHTLYNEKLTHWDTS